MKKINIGSFLGGLGTAMLRGKLMARGRANGRTETRVGDQADTSAPPKITTMAPVTTPPATSQEPVAVASPVASSDIVATDIAAEPQAAMPETFTRDDWMNTPEPGAGANPDWDQLPA